MADPVDETKPWALNAPDLTPRPEPSLGETVWAGARSSVVGSALYQPSLVEWISPSNTTPVSDAEIEQRLIAENMTEHIANFTKVQTQGELDAKISKIAYEKHNEEILKASGWGAWVAAKAVEGVLDPAVFIPATAGIKVGIAGGSLARQAGAFAVGGGIAGAASHLEQAALQETTDLSLKSLLLSTASGVLVGGLIGFPLAKAITAGEARKLGDAVRNDLVNIVDGTAERNADTLVTSLSDTIVDVTRNPSAYQAEAKALAKMMGEEPSASQIALAKSLGMEALSRTTAKAFGKSIPLEMMASDFNAAREWASNVFMLRGNLVEKGADGAVKDATAPISVWAMTGEVNGVRDLARKDFIEAWKEWAVDTVKWTSLERFLPANASASDRVLWLKNKLNIADHDASLRAFADLVTTARIYGEGSGLHLEGDLAAQVMHPGVQKALKAYANFDSEMANRTIKAGLMREDSLIPNHIYRSYTERARAESKRFEEIEAQQHFNKVWGETKQTSRKEYLDAVTKLRDEFNLAIEKSRQKEAVDASLKPEEAFRKAEIELQKKVDKEVSDLHEKFFGKTIPDGPPLKGRIERELDVLEKELDREYRDRIDALTRPDTKENRAWRDAQIAKDRAALEESRKRSVASVRKNKGNKADIQAEIDRVNKWYEDRINNVPQNVAPLSRNVSRAKYEERLLYVQELMNDKHMQAMSDLRANMEKAFQEEAAALYKRLDPNTRAGQYFLRERKRTAASVENEVAHQAKLERNALTDAYIKAVDDAFNAYTERVSFKARGEQEIASRNHANGVIKAVVLGETGSGGNKSGVASYGNLTGSRTERTVVTPDHILHANGWIDTDLLGLINRQARSEGMASVVAMKFRRKMTEEEAAAAKNDRKDAYWVHGYDPETVPDLNMSGPREAIIREALQKGADIDSLHGLIHGMDAPGVGLSKVDITEAKRLADQAKQMLSYIDEATATVLGKHVGDMDASKFTSAVSLAKAVNFSTTLGHSFITNITDAFKLMSHHSFGNFVAYSAARWMERLNDKTFLRGASTKELRDQAGALSFGMEKWGSVHMSGFMDQFDPYARSGGRDAMEGAANVLSKVGGNLFLLNQLNGFVKSAAYGLSQFRLSKIALSDFSKLSEWDRAWLREIGMRENDLVSIKTQLNAQGITDIKGSELGRIKLNEWTDDIAKSRFLAAMNRDVTSNSIQPNMGSTPRWAQTPVGSLLFQFLGFTMSAMESLTMRTGQQVANGQAYYAAQTIMFLLAGSTAVYMLKGFARGDLDNRMKSIDRTPGQLTYSIIDNTGLLAPITLVNNLFEDATGVGLKKLSGKMAGDQGMLLASSARSEARAAGLVGLTGVFGKQVDTLSKDVINPLGPGGKFTDQNRRNIDRLIPFNNALPFSVASRLTEFQQRGFDAFRKTQGARATFEGIIPGSQYLFAKQKF